jgi:TrmH family RNA methyltransferase
MRQNIVTLSKSNDLYQVILALKQNRKKRNELDEVFVEGIESIKQALVSGRVELKKVIFADYRALSDWGKALVDSERFPDAISLSAPLFAGLSDRDEPSELMITARVRRDGLDATRVGKDSIVVVFDRPSDHGNLGSLIRTANAFGADLIITHGHCVDAFDPKTIRSSLGAVFHTPVVHVDSFPELASWVERERAASGLTLAGTDSTGAVSLAQANLAPPVAIVLGNEAKGMSVNLKGIVERVVSIPMRGNVNSLNVACAGSILLWAAASARDAR